MVLSQVSSADLCVDMCVDMCPSICADMCADLCSDLRVDLCADLCVDMCVDMYMGHVFRSLQIRSAVRHFFVCWFVLAQTDHVFFFFLFLQVSSRP